MSGIRGYEFETYFKEIPIVNNLYLSVFSIDKIPKSIKEKHFFICNLSPSESPGSHWIVVVRSEKDTLEIFNSLGVENIDNLKPNFRFRNHFNFTFNEQRFQSNQSTSCGLFCIYFIIHRILNFDMCFEHILEDIFNVDPQINENLVINFCDKLLTKHDNLFD
jgi:hypothetical protein